MRLLVDCHVFDGKYQGTRTYLQGLYRQMVKFSDIDFYFAAQNIEKLKACFGNKPNVHYIQLHCASSLKRLVFEFPKIIKDNLIDLAHYQYVSPLRKCCREIVTVHDLLFLDYPQYFSLFYRIKNNFLFRRSAKRADILLTVSDYSRQSIERHFQIASNQIYLTPNAVLHEECYNEECDVKTKYSLDKYIITVSRIEPRKNHLALLKAFVELKLYEKDYKLFFVGTPDLAYRSFARYYSRLPGGVQRFILFKSVDYQELIELYRNASLFVFPSFAEGFGIPPLEAVEYGCPVLCSNTTAMAEFSLPPECFFSPLDLNEMKGKMMKLLERKPDMNDVRKELRMKFDWEKTALTFYNLLKQRFA